MEKTNVLTLIITLVVGVILTGALLGPVISDATKTTETFTNAGYYSMDELDTNAELSILWEKSAPMIINVGSKTVDMSGLPAGRSYTLVGGDDFVVRYDKINSTSVVIQGFSNESNSYFNVGDGTEVTITVSNGEVACHSNRTDISGGVTTTYTYSDVAYAINPFGNGTYSYIMKDAAQAAYVKGDSMIYFVGVTNVTTTAVVAIYAEGTLNDGMTITTAGLRNVTTVDSYTDPVATYTAVDGYKDLYALEKYEFTINYDSNQSYDATYTYFIVPATVTAELSNHLTPGQISLMGAIPVIVIVALLMAAVGAIALRRAD